MDLQPRALGPLATPLVGCITHKTGVHQPHEDTEH